MVILIPQSSFVVRGREDIAVGAVRLQSTRHAGQSQPPPGRGPLASPARLDGTRLCSSSEFFDEEALEAVQTLYPWRHVTRCESVIVVFPLGTTWLSHTPEAVILRGHFDMRDRQAVQAAHSGRTGPQDGVLLTVGPSHTVTAHQGAPQKDPR